MHPPETSKAHKGSFLRKIVLLAALLGAVAFLSAAEGISLRVGIYQNKPKIYVDEDGEASGIYVELLNEIARKEGWQLDYVQGNWTDCIERLKEGEIDILPDMAFSLDRAETYRFNTIPVLESWSQAYARPKQNINSLFDIENKRVALLKGSVQEKEFQQLMDGFGLAFTPISLVSFEEAFDWVQKDLADVVIANYFFGQAHYQKYGLALSPVIFNPATLHFALRPQLDSLILLTLDAYLHQWKASPHSIYYTTLKSYLMPSTQAIKKHNHHPFLLVIVLLASVLSLVLGMLFKSFRQRKAAVFAAQQQFKEEVEKFRSYIDHAPVGVFVVNELGRFIEVNRKACESTGYAEKELLQKDITGLLAEDSRMEGIRHFQRVVAEGKAKGIYAFNTRHLGKRYFSVNAVKISNQRFLGFVSDVSERISLEAEKQQHKDRLNNEVEEKTRELSQRIAELEQFQEATIERELRMEDLRKENEILRAEIERWRREK